jgi:4-hydroxymandelate oxidase
MSTAPELGTIPPGTVNLTDYTEHAHARLDANAWAYFGGGAGDELTMHANRHAWDELKLHPRVLRSLTGGHTRSILLERELEHPILLAPVAFQRLAHPDGELGSAHAAAAQNAGLVLSAQASTTLEQIAQAVLPDPGRGPLWFQLYLQHDKSFTQDLVQRAEQAGYEALVVTIDAPCSGARDRERRADFRLPPGIGAVNLTARKPPEAIALQAGQSALFDGLLTTAPTWSDIEWLQGITRLPILLKGILHEDDARQAAQLGVSGLIVSNHGGRTLDTAVPTAWALPRIVQAVGPQLPVLVDGGIRRGTDVLKAIALGANAVLIGRPYVHALATAGALGVAHVIRLLRDELEIAMALTGCATLADITPDVLFQRP